MRISVRMRGRSAGVRVARRRMRMRLSAVGSASSVARSTHAKNLFFGMFCVVGWLAGVVGGQ